MITVTILMILQPCWTGGRGNKGNREIVTCTCTHIRRPYILSFCSSFSSSGFLLSETSFNQTLRMREGGGTCWGVWVGVCVWLQDHTIRQLVEHRCRGDHLHNALPLHGHLYIVCQSFVLLCFFCRNGQTIQTYNTCLRNYTSRYLCTVHYIT